MYAHTLLVAATENEVAPLLAREGAISGSLKPGSLVHMPYLHSDLLITGPGSAPASFHTASALLGKSYKLAINLGIAGSFLPDLMPGEVVSVTRDRFADFGSESPDGFVPGEAFPFTGLTEFPFTEGWLIPEIPVTALADQLRKVAAITSDTVHTDPASIHRLSELFQPDIETMEGAAFFYASMMVGVPCLQIRAVSNYVGPRHLGMWKVQDAIEALNQFFISHFHV